MTMYLKRPDFHGEHFQDEDFQLKRLLPIVIAWWFSRTHWIRNEMAWGGNVARQPAFQDNTGVSSRQPNMAARINKSTLQGLQTMETEYTHLGCTNFTLNSTPHAKLQWKHLIFLVIRTLIFQNSVPYVGQF